MKYFLDTEFHEYKNKNILSKSIDTIELISIGLVCEDGREYYAISKNFDLKTAWKNEWLRENVLKDIWEYMYNREGTYFKTHHSKLGEWSYKGLKNFLKWQGKTNKQIVFDITQFTLDPKKEGFNSWLGDTQSYYEDITRSSEYSPEFYAYYADYDWVVFCWLYGRMIDLPKKFPMYCRDLKQDLDNVALNLSWNQLNKLHCPKCKHRVYDYLEKNEGLSLESRIQDLKKDPNFPIQGNEHNALDDAKWNKELYKFIQSYI